MVAEQISCQGADVELMFLLPSLLVFNAPCESSIDCLWYCSPIPAHAMPSILGEKKPWYKSPQRSTRAPEL